MVAVSAQVVACQVHKHHMLGIFFGVVAQKVGISGILLRVAGAKGGARYRVDIGDAAFYAAVRSPPPPPKKAD